MKTKTKRKVSVPRWFIGTLIIAEEAQESATDRRFKNRVDAANLGAPLPSGKYREALRGLLEVGEFKTLGDAAKKLGISYSDAVLSQYLAGTYPTAAAVTKIDEAVAAYLERSHESKERQARAGFDEAKFPYTQTSIADLFHEVARTCHIERKMGRCTGDSGIGKTTAAENYARRNPDVILVNAHRRYTTKEVFADIAEQLGLEPKGTVHRMMIAIVGKLKKSGRLIIIDEAEHLRVDTLDELRQIHDRAGVGILYVGLERFKHQLRSMRGDYEYITNRIKAPLSLRRATSADTELLVRRVIPLANGLCRVFHSCAKGDVRLLETGVFGSLRVANGDALTEEMVRGVFAQLAD